MPSVRKKIVRLNKQSGANEGVHLWFRVEVHLHGHPIVVALVFGILVDGQARGGCAPGSFRSLRRLARGIGPRTICAMDETKRRPQ